MVRLWNGEDAQWRAELRTDMEEMKTRVGDEPRQLLVEFPGSSLADESCARVRVRFKGGEPPEAVMKINDTLLNIIP